MRNPFFRSLLGILALSLAACGTLEDIGSPAPSEVEEQQYREQVSQLLEQARNAESPELDQLYLRAAVLLNTVSEVDWARNLLGSVDPDMLFADDYINYILTYSDIALNDDAYFLAQRILTNERLEQQLQQQPPEVVEQLRTRRAELFDLLGDAANSVAERVSLSNLLSDDDKKDLNQDALWHTMMGIPAEELRRISDTEHDPLLKGWYALGIISKNNDADLQQQQNHILDWMQAWPNHPASQRLPSDLRLLGQLVEEQPQQVALLLPLTGDYQRIGESVRDGFFAAYFEARKRGTFTPVIRIYDSNVSDINQIYDLAVSQGSELIIGPIETADAKAIDDLNTRFELPVPTLALGFIQAPYGFATNLYQFSFSRDSEAKHVAQRAWLEGHRNAAILAPQTENGQRSTIAFINEWEQLGGKIVANSPYDQTKYDFTDVIDQTLSRTESRDRYREMRRLLGKSLEFEPRLREDIDMVFLEAQPQQGRMLKATLDAALAGGIPVYATRRIYTGQADPQKDQILKGIRFSTLPWYFEDSLDEKQNVSQFARPDAGYDFLYALGVDAYKLYPRLKQLEAIPGVRFTGTTGLLQMTADRIVEQQQIWAHMVDGEATPLPTVVSETFIE